MPLPPVCELLVGSRLHPLLLKLVPTKPPAADIKSTTEKNFEGQVKNFRCCHFVTLNAEAEAEVFMTSQHCVCSHAHPIKPPCRYRHKPRCILRIKARGRSVGYDSSHLLLVGSCSSGDLCI